MDRGESSVQFNADSQAALQLSKKHFNMPGPEIAVFMPSALSEHPVDACLIN